MDNLDKQHSGKGTVIIFFIVCFGMTALMGFLHSYVTRK